VHPLVCNPHILTANCLAAILFGAIIVAKLIEGGGGTDAANISLNSYAPLCNKKAGGDECVAAAAIYDCGVEKVPDITRKMVEVGKGSSVEVIPIFS
jgi:hypothetical protein